MGKRHDGGPVTPSDVAKAREAELRASCSLLGAVEPVCWRLPDGRLRDEPEGARLTAALLRSERPDLVLSLGADGAYGHPDHVAFHRWALDAWEALPAPGPILLFAAFPRGLFLPQYEKCRGMMGDPPDPPPSAIGAARHDLQVDITVVRAQKLAAIAAHRSQLPGGDPFALFPPGVVDGLLDYERFALAHGVDRAAAAALLAGITAASPAEPADVAERQDR
jgi:N-acetyl-1-D-myo-inositol-2-amino-2-deoxy-alpha-D-glucopyranoside deacetylase